MSYQLTCSEAFTVDPSGFIQCVGVVESSAHVGLTIEDAQILSNEVLVLFAVVFGVLAVKKVFS
jgi:hypothetical protein